MRTEGTALSGPVHSVSALSASHYCNLPQLIENLHNYIPPTLRKRILFGYEEFKYEKAELRIYTLESVAVDKICRILDVDNEPRDLYDLWYLLKLGLNAGIIKKGLNKKFGYDIYYPNLLSAIGNEDYRQNWEIRLTKQIKDLPHYEFILKELEGLIEKKLIA